MTPRKKKDQPVVDEQAETPPEESSSADPGSPAVAQTLPDGGVAAISRMVAFHLGAQRYGFSIDSVQEIQQIVEFAQVPDDTAAVLGLLNLRGLVVPAIDMRRLLGMEPREFDLETPMVICRSANGLVAFIVDGVDDVAELPEGCLQPPPQMHSLAGRMLGVCRLDEGMVFLLDVDRLLEPIDLDVVGEVPEG